MTTDDNNNAPVELISSSVIESQERAAVDIQIATAKRYPRDLVKVQNEMIKRATRNQEIAEACSYNLERDGHSIEGPSVRLAEIAVSCYGNISALGRVIANDGKVIVGQGVCYDLENNIRIGWEVQRRITDKRGRTYSEDMQVTTGNAAAAIAFRNAVFKVVDSDLVDKTREAARKVAIGDITNLSQRRTRLLRRFAALGANESRVLALLGYEKADQITLADVERLIGIGTAISEGTTSVDEQFPAVVARPNMPSKPVAEPPVEDKTKPVKTSSEPPRPPEPPPKPTPEQQRENATPAAYPDDGTLVSEKPPPQPPTVVELFTEKLRTAGVSIREALHAGIAYGFRTKSGDKYTPQEIDELKVKLGDLREQHFKIVLADWEEFAIIVQQYRDGKAIY